MGFPEGRGVLLIGRRGGSRRACPRDGRAKSPAEMRLRCERRGEGVGADMRARRDGGGARGAGRAGASACAGRGERAVGGWLHWAEVWAVRGEGERGGTRAQLGKEEAAGWAKGLGRTGERGGLRVGFCFGFFLSISFSNSNKAI